MIKFDNIDEACQHYVNILNGPANGWGQHCCPQTGVQAHEVLYWCYKQFGEDDCSITIGELLLESK